MSTIIQQKCRIHQNTLNVDHTFHWSVLARAPTNTSQRKVLEAYYIVLEKPTLNDQLEPDRLNLFRNGVTRLCFLCKYSPMSF